LAFAACFSESGALGYFRPYLVATVIGTSLFQESSTTIPRWLQARWLVYVAAVSYSLYILHPVVTWGWLGSGSKLVKYIKRVPELAAVFGLAHLSTFYYEAFWIRTGKRWSHQLAKRSPTEAAIAIAESIAIVAAYQMNMTRPSLAVPRLSPLRPLMR
jgi:peptidoglycan/LPS O-acetylase OafA/YrhL